ncbi:MAG: hypothetical protein WC236_07390 [Gallionellaceae bacterium]|jgi:hypothetical protein
MERYDEKAFLDLMQEYKSEDTRKARRNLSVISFVVISVSVLGIKLNELKILGVDLSRSSELNVLLLGLGLIGYWSVMFSLAWRHDREIQKERTVALTATVAELRERLTKIEQIKEQNAGKSGYVPDDYAEVKSALDTYERQQNRTVRATRLGQVIREMELHVPGSLALVSASILTAEVARAL